MAHHFISAIILTFVASPAFGDDISEKNTELLVDATRVLDDCVALYSSINDPREKCLTTTRPVFKPDERFAVYLFHYQGEDGNPGSDDPNCVNLTATDSFLFGFEACKDWPISTYAQGYYYDGSTCFLARFPLFNGAHCLLWVKRDYKDSVPKKCVTAFEKYCGTDKYRLYDKTECS